MVAIYHDWPGKVRVFRFMAFSGQIISPVSQASAASVAFTPVAFLASLWPDWGSRPENKAAHGSRSVLGKKFLRSGRFAFARWLSIRLPTVPRFRMVCGKDFSKNSCGRQEVIFPRENQPVTFNLKPATNFSASASI